jgi:hypothetical protein
MVGQAESGVGHIALISELDNSVLENMTVSEINS